MTDNPLAEAVDAAIRQDIERVSSLNGSSFCYEYDTGCMDFDGTFRPSEIATAALRAIEDAGYRIEKVGNPNL